MDETKEYLGTVQELVDTFDTNRIAVFIKDGDVSHSFEPEDVDHIPDKLLGKEIKKFKYIPAGKNRLKRIPLLDIIV